MTDAERQRLSLELGYMWPKQFKDFELADWCHRVDRYRVTDVLAALNEHKNSSKWKPQPSEILARLKGKEIGAGDHGDRSDSFANACRKMNPQWQDATDLEVILRFWRSVWYQYATAANKRRAQIREYHPAGKATADHCDRQYHAMQNHVTSSCTNCLAATGLSIKQAERATAFVFDPPEQFRVALDDVRTMAGSEQDRC